MVFSGIPGRHLKSSSKNGLPLHPQADLSKAWENDLFDKSCSNLWSPHKFATFHSSFSPLQYWLATQGKTLLVIPQFDWLRDVCGCVMSPILGIYWVDLGFINNYNEPQLWLVLLRYSADVASTFPWVVTYGIRVGSVIPCRPKTLPHKVGPNKGVRDLSGGDCNTPIWLIAWCVWVCDESHIVYLLGRYGLY